MARIAGDKRTRIYGTAAICVLVCSLILVDAIFKSQIVAMRTRVASLVDSTIQPALRRIGEIEARMTPRAHQPTNSHANDSSRNPEIPASYMLEVAQLQAQLEKLLSERPLAYRIHSKSSLFKPRVVEGKILDDANRIQLKGVDNEANTLLSTDDRLILEGEQPVVEIGLQHEIREDRLAFIGQTVVGRTQQVGHRLCSLQTIISSDFKHPARLLRVVDGQFVHGARGSIHGTGSGCLLRYISAQEPVAAGDLVVTDTTYNSVPLLCLYGRVTAADLPSGATEWNIEVTPFADLENLSTVSVLAEELHSDGTLLTN